MNFKTLPSFFPKLKRFLAHLALTAALLSFLLFVLSKTGFSLGLNRPQIGRLTLYLVILAGLVNLREIKAIIDKTLAPKAQKRFVLLTLANIALTLIFIIGYAIFQYGSPLVYEDRIGNFRSAKQIEITEEPIIQSFTATSNNLGTIGIKLISQQINEEEIEQTEEKYPETFFPVLFKIKEQGSEDYFYENVYYFDSSFATQNYLFGFPIQAKSEEKKYIFEINKTQETLLEQEEITLQSFYLAVQENREGSINFFPRYVFSLREIRTDYKPIIKNIFLKINQLSNNEAFLNVLTLHLFFSILISILYLTKKINPRIVSYFLFFGLIFFFLLSFSFILEKFKVWEYFGIISYLFFLFVLAFFYILQGKANKKADLKIPSNKKKIFVICFTFISLLIVFLYFYKLGSFGIQMDEFYHANVVKSYLEGEELFTNYKRSRLTSLLGLWSTQLFSFLKIKANNEFVLRFPFAFLGVINGLLVFLISKEKAKNNIVAIITALLFAVDPWIIQFARYFRFYTPSITFILLCLYLVKKSNFKIGVIFLTFFASVLSYLYLQEYLLILLCFLGFLLVIRLLEEKKKILIAPPLLFLAFLIIKRFLVAINSETTYNLISWSFNFGKMKTMFLWLLYNYGSYLLLSLGGLLFSLANIIKRKNAAIIKNSYFEIFLLINLIFLFFYVVHVPFNFTFRPILFFLPIIYIIAISFFYKVFSQNKIALFLPVLMLLITTVFSIKYHVAKEGDKYFPTRLVYEKLEIAVGNKDMAIFLSEYINEKKINDYLIHYIGLSGALLGYDIKPAANKKNNEIVTYRHSALSRASLQELINNIQGSPEKIHFVVINANAYSNRTNYTYKIFFGRRSVTEVDPALAIFVGNNPDFKEIYLSKDGVSKIFIKESTL